jgi:hypothetical protein
MLGLLSAISRRDRMQVARQLDRRIATELLPFSLVHQRQETLRSVQAQARALPEVVLALQALVERIEQRSQHVDAQLLERQANFQREVTRSYGELAQSVGSSLKESLAAGARAAGETITPVVSSAMSQFVQETQRLQERLGASAQTRVDALLAAIDSSLARTRSEQARSEQERLQAWTKALQGMSAELQGEWRRMGEASSAQAGRTLERVTGLLDQSEALVRSRADTEARWVEQHGERMDQLAGVWRSELAALRQQEDQRGEAAVARLGELEAAVAQHLAKLGAALEAPLTRLLQTASEVPQAAAGVITQLRSEMSRISERDNLALQERTELLQGLGTLLQSVNAATGEQRAAIEAMVASASSVMEQATAQFAQALEAQSGRAAEVAAQVNAGAVEVASLAEAFGQSVQGFQASNDKLSETLQRVEASLTRSTARSDEQLAYYVAQAREVIDLSIASQQGLVDNLRHLNGRTQVLAEERG